MAPIRAAPAIKPHIGLGRLPIKPLPPKFFLTFFNSSNPTSICFLSIHFGNRQPILRNRSDSAVILCAVFEDERNLFSNAYLLDIAPDLFGHRVRLWRQQASNEKHSS